MVRPTNLSYLPGAEPEPAGDEAKLEPLRPRVARPAPAAPKPSEDPFDARLREEIETLQRYVETSTYLLGQDAALRYRYGTELGNLKHVGRTLGQLALLAGAADKAAAVEFVADAELKARMKRRPIAPLFVSKH